MPLYSPIEDTGCNWIMKQTQKNKYWNIPLSQGTATTQVTEAWKPLLTLWLLQPSSRWSFWPQAFWRASDRSARRLSEEEAEGMWDTAPALTSTKHLCLLLTTETYLLINLDFLTQLTIVFCPTVTPPLSYPEKNSNQGTPGHPEGMEKENGWVLVISAPSTSCTTSWLPKGRKHKLESFNCRK